MDCLESILYHGIENSCEPFRLTSDWRSCLSTPLGGGDFNPIQRVWVIKSTSNQWPSNITSND